MIDLREDALCSCGRDGNHVDHWDERLQVHVHSGQCCTCINIRAYYNGASPADWDSGDHARVEYAEENSDEIHVCDLVPFIALLQKVQTAAIGTG